MGVRILIKLIELTPKYQLCPAVTNVSTGAEQDSLSQAKC